MQRGKIISERTPNARSVGAPMNFNQLNLDSEGAFTIADQEAKKTQLTFDRVDYALKSGTNGGAPVWELELFETRSGPVGLITIAADSGTVLRRQLDGHRGGSNNDRDYLEDRRNPPPDVVLQRRYGDCKDKSALLVNLLREVGIDARPVLMRTGRRTGLPIRRAQPTAGSMNATLRSDLRRRGSAHG